MKSGLQTCIKLHFEGGFRHRKTQSLNEYFSAIETWTRTGEKGRLLCLYLEKERI